MAGAIALMLVSSRAETDPKYYAVMATAEVQASPERITLRWDSDANATGYTIARRNGNSWSTVATLSGSVQTWTDSNVTAGGSYEYRLSKTTSRGYKGTGFLLAGIDAPLKDTRGKVILLVDNTYATQLASELRRLEWDLAGDGWTVLRRNVSRNDSVQSIKNIIKADYYADPPNVKAVFILGHVPVPYSGNMAPDGHGDHVGAWTADLYYGDMDGNWSDSSVSNTSAAKPWNRNVPGDGKFDQSTMPSDVEIAVGRVDFYNMTCYANKTVPRSELDLLRAYLNKDHAFRHRLFTVERRGLVCDNFGEFSGEAFAANGWRNFGAFFGAENVAKVGYGQFFNTLASQDYLWSYGTGGGSWYTCNGIGGSDDFATTEVRSVFTMFLGSYFGDWDNESAFLRAPLGSGYVLTTSWAGRPHWFYHHMGLGEPISVSTVASQNNAYGESIPSGYERQVHAALLGDPTLRMHPVIPVSNLSGTASGSSMTLNWNVSTDTDVQGYHVYRGNEPASPFTRLTSSPVKATSFTDTSYTAGRTYMVRAVKLERSGSGTYFNASQGVFFPEGGSGSSPGTPTPAAELAATPISTSQINLTWQDTSAAETGFRVERKTGTAGTWMTVATLAANTTSYINSGLMPATTYYFRVVAFNSAGGANPSNEAAASTSPVISTAAAASFVKSDIVTQGSWIGVFGAEGHHVITGSSSYPAYVLVTANGKTDHYWNTGTSDPRVLPSMDGGRTAACWYSPGSFTIDFNFTDGQFHKPSLYFLDWDSLGRSQRIDLLDAQSGTVLDSRTISDFSGGIYLTWNVKGSVSVRVTCLSGPNAVVSGLFFDSAPGAETGKTRAGGVVSGNFHLQITGSAGEQFDVFASEDLCSWVKVDTVTLTEPTFNFIDSTSSGKRLRFYRAVAAP